MLYGCLGDHLEAVEEIRKAFGDNVARIVHGLIRIQKLYEKNPVIESENFRNLLLSFAEDMRVILIMIADRVNIMRQIRDTPNKEAQHEVSEEASYLYAPLAHKLGLYTLKSELEDLSLKYLEHDAYYMIKDKLNATKQARDAYIDRFIGPVKARLEEAGLKFHIKGRTKSIHSIWQKMKKQQCGFEGIYDLFAIRIILDAPLEKRNNSAGRYTPSSPICINPTPNDCVTGSACRRAMATRASTSLCSDRKTNGWKCRYAPSVWTTLLSTDLRLTGATKVSRVAGRWTNGLPTSARPSKPVTDCKSWTSSAWT